MQNTTIVPTQTLNDGTFVLFSFIQPLIERLKSGSVECNYPNIRTFSDVNLLSVSLFIGSLPISKPSNAQFWPVLGRLDHSVNKQPFVISLYMGNHKPKGTEYLSAVAQEIVSLEKNGLIIENKKYKFIVSCIIADAPARSFIKGIKGHNAYFGCEKCTEEGEWVDGRVVFLNQNAAKRNDDDFRNFRYGDDHQVAVSPLNSLQLGLVSQIPLDYMHLVLIGVMRKLLSLWVIGPLEVRLESIKVKYLSNLIMETVPFITSDFVRKPRSVSELKYWKATEFRLFLLYVGPVVLRSILPSHLYNHFLLLHCSIRILAGENACVPEYNICAKNMLKEFVRLVAQFYSRKDLVYDVHSLIHLPDDVLSFGPLDNFSAFPFESYLKGIKGMLRSGSKPLQQVFNRVSEMSEFSGPQYQSSPLSLCCKEPDNCYLTVDKKCIIINQISNENSIDSSEKKLQCYVFKKYNSFFSEPCDSNKLNIFYVSALSQELQTFCKKEILCKCILFTFENSYICMPLINNH